MFMELDTIQFPERNWNDFVVVMLGWWCTACTALVSGGQEQELMFMDGPFQLILSSHEPDVWASEFQRLRSVSTVLDEFQPLAGIRNELRIDPAHFLNSLVRCSEAVLAECDRRGWRTDDVDELERALTGLRLSR
jgi:hypothetical protein